TDTGCSIRLPAAACEVVGLKPRFGEVPVDGVFPLVPLLDTVGPMGTTVADVALLWSVLAGKPVPEPRLDGLTVGLLRQPPGIGDGRATERSDAAEQWVPELERLGALGEHVAAVPARGAALARGHVPRPRGRVRRRHAREARGRAARGARR